MLAVVGLAWPFALTLGAVLLRWKELRSRVGLLVSGVLGCFGVQAFLARLTRYLFWTYFAPLEPHYSMARHIADPIVIIVASAALGVPLLMWLSTLLGGPPASGDRLEGAKSPDAGARLR